MVGSMPQEAVCASSIQQPEDPNFTYAVGSVTTMAFASMDMAAIAARASLQYILDNIFRLCDFVLWQWSRFEMDSEANNEAAAEMKRITNKMMKGI